MQEFTLALTTNLPTDWPWTLLIPLAALLTAFATTAAATPLVIRIARQRGWVANPTSDRWHQTPTALMGGIAIFAGVAVASALFVGGLGAPMVIAAAALMFISGATDDRRGLSPTTKILLQLAAAALLIYEGYMFEFGGAVWFSAALTVFWILGITNAVNLIDNMDGLSAGVSAIAAISLAGMAALSGAGPLAALALAVAGAAGGFLFYNFKPAKIFMGDCGSLFLGFVLAATAVMVQAEFGMRGIAAVFMTALVLGVPIMDTTLVTIERTLHGKPVSEGGRDHTSHRLVGAGLTERQAVVLIYAVAGMFAVLAPLFAASDIRLRVSLSIFIMIGAIVFAAQIAAQEVYETSDADPARRRSWAAVVLNLPRALFGRNWKKAFALAADVAIVLAAFVTAHYLRFEGGLTAEREAFLVQSLPFIAIARIPVFAGFGLYRAIWRHAGSFDMARAVVAVTVSSLLAYLMLGALHGFGSVSNGVMVIDWMAVTLGVLFSRFGFRGIRSYLVSVSSAGTPVAIYGAGSEAAETLRLLRMQKFRPVAIVDNESELHGLNLQGVPVAGGMEQIAELKKTRGIEELILPQNTLTDEQRAAIEAQCRQAHLPCRRIHVQLARAQEQQQ